jgi:predicted dehydrogenase
MSLNWGILGLGKIAHKFVKDLDMVENCHLTAVASRSIVNAKYFADQYNAKYFYAAYHALFINEEVDIIYIATPHNSHFKYALEAMNHGKHVLCEKPLAVNRKQVLQLIETSKANNVFLMEALWSRFNPSIEAVLSHVQNQDIGDVNFINADFSFYGDADPESRLFNMKLAGGALLDIGVYPIFLSYLILGYPEEIVAKAIMHETGADLQTSAILKYKKGFANIMCGFRSDSDMVAKIFGTKGRISIDKSWHESEGYKIEKDGVIESHSLPTKGKGFTYEIMECLNCIAEGKIESSKWSHHDSLNLISICDEIRSQIGLTYPFE